MTRETILAAGRAAASVGFVDSCVIERRGTPVTDPLTGVVTTPMTPVYGTVGTPGVCGFQQAAAPWAGQATVGQAGVGLAAVELQLPVVGSEGITLDDVVTCITAVNDADLVGKRFTVMGAHHATRKTTRRLPLMEILG